MKQKNKKEGFLSMLLGASLLGNLLSGKGIVRAGSGNKKGKGILELSMEIKWIFNVASSFNLV